MPRLSPILLAPLLCLGLLAGIEGERLTHLEPADAEPYHARARAAIGLIPRDVRVDGQTWSAVEVDVPEAAIKLLGNAATLSLHYTGRLGRQDCSADLLVVSCQDSRDMRGHYPLACYPGNGFVLIDSGGRGIAKVGSFDIPYMAYTFEKESRGRAFKIVVYNFFVVPGRGIVRDIQDVRDAAEDYQRRFFGATQFQLVVSAELPLAWREQVLREMIGANDRLLRTLTSAEVQTAP